MAELTEPTVEVKAPCGRRILAWMDDNPRIGWWIAFLSVVNVLLNVLDLVK